MRAAWVWAACLWVGVGCTAQRVALAPATEQEREQARRVLGEEGQASEAEGFGRFLDASKPKAKQRAPLLTASGAQVGRGGQARAKRKGEVVPQQPTLVGNLGLDLVAVDYTVRDRNFVVSGCYEVSLKKDPKLRGEIRVAYTIGPKGKVVSAKPLKNELLVETYSCLERALKIWQFPRPKNGDVDVEQSWHFAPLP